MTRLGRFLRDIWTLAGPYWFSEDKWAGRGLLAVLVVLNLALVYLNVLFARWNNAFYNTLQDKDYAGFVTQLLRFSGLAALFIIVAVYQLYLNQMLQIRWRRWMTDRYLGTWLGDRAYYRLQLEGGGADNPDQRIAEDVKFFIGGSGRVGDASGILPLGLGLLSAVVTLASFLTMLWTLSGSLPLHVGGMSLTVPGYMVWVALVYAFVGTWLTMKIGRPLVQLNFDQQRYEADFRFSLVRLRENAEGVALYGGERDEHQNFRERFAHVVANWWGLMRRQKRLTWFTAGYRQIAIIFPFVVAAPRFFRGEIMLGGLMQTALAFGQVQEALSFIISSYSEIAEWQSVVNRLIGFHASIERCRANAAQPGIRVGEDPAPSIALDQIAVALPDGRQLLEEVTLSLPSGSSVLLTGPSGAGKSTLFRAIAGIWPFGTGAVRRPTGARILFLPQKPYLPVGTLREVVSYPTAVGGVPEAVIVEALEACGLPELAARLDERENWTLRLSPGEQQRIAFARALVQQPEWLFLDEATSAVDEATEARLYTLMRARLPGTTVVSIGHRPTLGPFHARRLVIAPADNGGAARVSEAAASAVAT
jgi:vitamin B12/bleomycin/antimicrobial peptide transport system ATP-binding/permease protein